MCDYVPTVFHSGSTCHGFWMFEVKTRRCLYFGNKSTTATGAWRSWGFSGVGCMSLQFSNVYGSFLKVGTPQNGWFPRMHVKCCIHIIVWINMHVCGCMCIYIYISKYAHVTWSYPTISLCPFRFYHIWRFGGGMIFGNCRHGIFQRPKNLWHPTRFGNSWRVLWVRAFWPQKWGFCKWIETTPKITWTFVENGWVDWDTLVNF